MAAAFSAVVGHRLSASPTVNYRRIRMPARGIIVNSGPLCRSRTMAMSMEEKARHESSIHLDEAPAPAPPERDFIGTPYVPVYVTLPLGIINMEGEIVDADSLLNQLNTLKSAANIDGVTIECWWGIVEPHAPHTYNWTAYHKLFKIVRQLRLHAQVVMSFHECARDDIYIPLPQWVTKIGNKNPDIYFTDKSMRRNRECLTWGIDNEPVLCGRTALEVYSDLMRSFRMEFDEFFKNRTISEIEIGLGPCGELRYPSHCSKFGWKYPGIGEFQCYDEYLFKSLQNAADAHGISSFGKAPENAGSYNSKPQNTEFFRDRGEYGSMYGMFFMDWYSQVLIDHADQVLGMANLAFKGTSIAAKLPGIHWWHNTESLAALVTAGLARFFDYSYRRIASMLKKHGSTLNFASLGSGTFDEVNEYGKAKADPERSVWEKEFLKSSADAYAVAWEVLRAAWYADIPVGGQNAHPCYLREGYNKILENAKPWGDPSCRSRLSIFTYARLGPTLMEKHNLIEFGRFVRKMHGVPPKVEHEEKQVKFDKPIENLKLGDEKNGLPPKVLHEEKQVKLGKPIENSKLGDEKNETALY